MVIGIITVQSALSGVTMREPIAQKRKGIAGVKESFASCFGSKPIPTCSRFEQH
jgi:hypothetical protein